MQEINLNSFEIKPEKKTKQNKTKQKTGYSSGVYNWDG